MSNCEYSFISENLTTNTNLITNVIGSNNVLREHLKKNHLINCKMYGITIMICVLLSFISVYINTTDLNLLFLNLICLIFLLLCAGCELFEHLRLVNGGQVFNIKTIAHIQIFWLIFKILLCILIPALFAANYQINKFVCVILQYYMIVFVTVFETYKLFSLKTAFEENIKNSNIYVKN